MKIESLEVEMQECADGAPLTTLVGLPAGLPSALALSARVETPAVSRVHQVLVRKWVVASRPLRGL